MSPAAPPTARRKPSSLGVPESSIGRCRDGDMHRAKMDVPKVTFFVFKVVETGCSHGHPRSNVRDGNCCRLNGSDSVVPSCKVVSNSFAFPNPPTAGAALA